jgi:ribonucleoside-diphosphate reductase alpha chain
MGILPTLYQQFIHLSRYARWNYDKGRRETWQETVGRYISFITKHVKEELDYTLEKNLIEDLYNSILQLDIMPSMRAMMTAGPALERDNAAAYNCAYLLVDSPSAFDETMYLLLCGCGVGFSVERQFICDLPAVPNIAKEVNNVYKIEDSKLGWCKALNHHIANLYKGTISIFDYSNIRPAGAPLKTFGGRASGPEPLRDLFKFLEKTFMMARGRKLNSLECHDIMCKIGEVVVAGGVRRSALLSLSNLSDDRMRHAKSGDWWKTNPHRAMANNSVAYTEKPDVGRFMDEWKALYESKSGERGIINREALLSRAISAGREGLPPGIGPNPCGEIILRPKQFCNLSEVVARPYDSGHNIIQKIRLATILGTLQSTITNFRYLSDEWMTNTESERLLGVSLTGIFDSPCLLNMSPNNLKDARNYAQKVNRGFAKKLGIEPSKAITTIKPSGTVSQLVGCSPGIHPPFSKDFYIRAVRQSVTDPMTQFMIESGFVHEQSIMSKNEVVFYFPIEVPGMKRNMSREGLSAITHLEFCKKFMNHWSMHNISATINVREHEWLEVAAWVYKHFDKIAGLSFLPYSDHIYEQAPYQECTKKEFEGLLERTPKNIDWGHLSEFEAEDHTKASQEFACHGGACEI